MRRFLTLQMSAGLSTADLQLFHFLLLGSKIVAKYGDRIGMQ